MIILLTTIKLIHLQSTKYLNNYMIRLLSALFSILIFSACTKEKTGIPIIHIHHPADFSWESKLPCEISYITNNDSIRIPAKIKRRGGISSKYYKGSFTFKLNENHALAGLPSDNDWILNAGYIDKTFMRHKISYDIFREMSPNNIAPEVAYVELYVNNKYEGLYQLTERMDSKRLKIDKTDPNATTFKGPPLFYKDKISYVQDSSNYYHQKSPDITKRDNTVELDNLRSFLFNANDSLFSSRIDQHFDINSIIDWHLILLLSNNSDGIMKNFYLYKQQTNTPYKIAIWDYDHSFGRDGDNEYNMMERNIKMEVNVLFCRLLELNPNQYKEKLIQKWNLLRTSNILTEENIYKKIAAIDQEITPYVLKNDAIWPANAEWYYDENSYQQEVDIIKEYLTKRLVYLDTYFKVLLLMDHSCDQPWPKA